jgi:hypothetical protein
MKGTHNSLVSCTFWAAQYNPKADSNYDGAFGVKDFSALRANFGK